MRFLVGLIVGILLGAAATAAGQWAYVGVYTAQELARSGPAIAQIYAIGVYDGLVAQQYHVTGGGAGQAHLDRARPCLRERVYDAKLSKWVRAVVTATSNRNAAVVIVDHACG